MKVELNEARICITGIAGFIGFHVAKYLLEDNSLNISAIMGIDNLNDYYDISLKRKRLDILKAIPNTTCELKIISGNIANSELLEYIFTDFSPTVVIHLAAQAGVRYSISNPDKYIESNIIGFYNILEACRKLKNCSNRGIDHLLYASSSSVYGANKTVPYSTNEKTDMPVSLYAATKKSNELMAYSYSNLYDIPCTGLRFFTVYGPFGRPDMAYFSFTEKMINNKKISLFNNGRMYRDFTYISDIVEGIIAIIKKSPSYDENQTPHKIYNIGNHRPVSLDKFVDILERCLLNEQLISKPAAKEFLPMQPGDVYQTYADVSDLESDFGFKPHTNLEEGIVHFLKWYKEYYILEGNI